MFALGLVTLTALVYWPGLGGGFVFDDFPNIVDNTALHVASRDWSSWISAAFASPAADLPRPLAMFTFAVNHYFTGLDPRPMKLTNLMIHLLNTLLVLALVRAVFATASSAVISVGRREWAARAAAAVWALHPINLMPVLFVVQRMESLSHTFVFAGLWLYLLGRQRQFDGRGGWMLIGGGLVLGTCLGALAKESAVLLPLYAFCVELCLFGFRGHGSRRDGRLILLFTCVLLVPSLLGMTWLLPKVLAPGAYAGRNFTLVERLMTEARVVLDYLNWSVFPSLSELSLYHDDYPISRGLWEPPSTAIAIGGVLTLLGLAHWLRTRRPLAALGLLWFLSAQLLTATIIPLELVYEHRNYFASLGVCIALADLVLLAPSRKNHARIGATIGFLMFVMFTACTHLRAREWSDPYRFAASEAAKHPRSPRATYALGQTLTIMTGYHADSPLLEPANRALEVARNVPGSGILPNSGLLLLAANTGMPLRDEWWLDMQRKLRERPLGPQETNAVGSLTRCARFKCQFPPHQMLATLEAAQSHGPNAEVMSLSGDYALTLQQPDRALQLWRQSAALAPREVRYRVNLIKLLIALGHEREASERIDSLRRSGQFGQHDAIADELQRRITSTP